MSNTMIDDKPPPDSRALEPLTECEIIALAMFLEFGDVRTEEQRPYLESGKKKLIWCAAQAIEAL